MGIDVSDRPDSAAVFGYRFDLEHVVVEVQSNRFGLLRDVDLMLAQQLLIVLDGLADQHDGAILFQPIVALAVVIGFSICDYGQLHLRVAEFGGNSYLLHVKGLVDKWSEFILEIRLVGERDDDSARNVHFGLHQQAESWGVGGLLEPHANPVLISFFVPPLFVIQLFQVLDQQLVLPFDTLCQFSVLEKDVLDLLHDQGVAILPQRDCFKSLEQAVSFVNLLVKIGSLDLVQALQNFIG